MLKESNNCGMFVVSGFNSGNFLFNRFVISAITSCNEANGLRKVLFCRAGVEERFELLRRVCISGNFLLCCSA